MKKPIKITTPLTEEVITKLSAGDIVSLSGVIWTARDTAHKRLIDALDNNQELPIDLKNQVIYFVGPCPPKPGTPIGSAGPTTSFRMNEFSPRVMRVCGLRGMIGKGERDQATIDAISETKGVYFVATGGAGALIAQCIKKSDIVAYPELGPEAIYRLEVEDFPLVVAIDSNGVDLFTQKLHYQK